MKVPRATYRLQFHSGFTLRDARGWVPYLSALGVSHVYASPLLQARPGSPHGYDVCDPSRINAEVGDDADLESFAAALRQHGMGLVLDIVPNHMAAAAENPWWWDLLKHGRHSRYAEYFDVDWEAPDDRLRGKVLLPVLGDRPERALDRGEIKVEGEAAEVTVRYFHHRFPVCPRSLPETGGSRDAVWLRLNADRTALARFLDQQHYRLACWREGDRRLNYRRFFTINDLAGLRVEEPRVFADAHRQIFQWYERGLLQGLRVDHPDGLRDPQEYLERLDRAVPGAWIIVEKILEPDESLPDGWPVAGTTGYDFLARVTGLFVDCAGEQPLTDFYAAFTGEPTDYAELLRAKKRLMLREGLGPEVSRLTRLLASLAAGQGLEGGARADELREALIELIACFPVYRTYSRADQISPTAADQARVTAAVAQARRARTPPCPTFLAHLAFLGDLLLLRYPGDPAREFVLRFQQLTGPAMAKGAEDTAFYCYNRFLALNEVGGDPGCFGLGVERFHQTCEEACQRWPSTLLATSTHDTKRSEDVRARLALLSEIPGSWGAAVRRWSAHNEKHRLGPWPDRNAEYLYYQTLVGAWPLPLDRALGYLTKAVREAKQHTHWHDPNAAYESALKEFVTGTLADREFVEDLAQFVAPLVPAGGVNALAQTLLKLTAPGVADIYQGTEWWDLSLADPDNRRPVDFARRWTALAELRRRLQAGAVRDLLPELLQDPADGRIKLFVIQRTLEFRQHHPELFRAGGYLPLPATGRRADHVCAFARRLGDTIAITIVPRLIMGLSKGLNASLVATETWADTQLMLPASLKARALQNLFTGDVVGLSVEGAAVGLRLADVWQGFPVALLTGPDAPL
jgi:(1->4)-alpha-D-glucan 1-alpha-D-glucosylmutase